MKVFPDEELQANEFTEGTALLNERYSFQIAFRSTSYLIRLIKVSVESELKDYITVRKVGLSPAEYVIQPDHDEHVLRSKSGLFPDPLYSLEEKTVNAVPNTWQSVWVTVELDDKVKAGKYPIDIVFEHP